MPRAQLTSISIGTDHIMVIFGWFVVQYRGHSGSRCTNDKDILMGTVSAGALLHGSSQLLLSPEVVPHTQVKSAGQEDDAR